MIFCCRSMPVWEPRSVRWPNLIVWDLLTPVLQSIWRESFGMKQMVSTFFKANWNDEAWKKPQCYFVFYLFPFFFFLSWYFFFLFAGVLVINVTWRGKTYVGTLLDSTRHVNQWAPPRYVLDKFEIAIQFATVQWDQWPYAVAHLFTLFERNSQSTYLFACTWRINYEREKRILCNS